MAVPQKLGLPGSRVPGSSDSDHKSGEMSRGIPEASQRSRSAAWTSQAKSQTSSPYCEGYLASTLSMSDVETHSLLILRPILFRQT